MELNFKPIQTCNLPLAYSFLRDALVVSFGKDSSRWPNNLGNLMENNYIEIIEKKLIRDPLAVVHVWLNGEIIGQIESSVKKDNPEFGYVSLYYLISTQRGSGLGAQLDDFVTRRFANLGCGKIELTVQESNAAAMKFYFKHGWINKGPHPLYQDGILMEKLLIK